jgi:hypothetical protein
MKKIITSKIDLTKEEKKNDWEVLMQKQEAQMQELLDNIKTNLVELELLSEDINDHWTYEDHIYRFYHQSFKVYYLQNVTIKCVEMLKKIAPKGSTFDSDFLRIIAEGTGKEFKSSHNRNWLKHTRPILEAFFHAKYFIEMVTKYGRELYEVPTVLPSGWAAVLCLYNLR